MKVERLIAKYGYAACWYLSWTEVEQAIAQGYEQTTLSSGIMILKAKS